MSQYYMLGIILINFTIFDYYASSVLDIMQSILVFLSKHQTSYIMSCNARLLFFYFTDADNVRHILGKNDLKSNKSYSILVCPMNTKTCNFESQILFIQNFHIKKNIHSYIHSKQ